MEPQSCGFLPGEAEQEVTGEAANVAFDCAVQVFGGGAVDASQDLKPGIGEGPKGWSVAGRAGLRLRWGFRELPSWQP